jgi:hypothetical protein
VKEKRSNTTRRNQQTTKKTKNIIVATMKELFIFIALSSILDYFSSLRTK